MVMTTHALFCPKMQKNLSHEDVVYRLGGQFWPSRCFMKLEGDCMGKSWEILGRVGAYQLFPPLVGNAGRHFSHLKLSGNTRWRYGPTHPTNGSMNAGLINH